MIYVTTLNGEGIEINPLYITKVIQLDSSSALLKTNSYMGYRDIHISEKASSFRKRLKKSLDQIIPPKVANSLTL